MVMVVEVMKVMVMMMAVVLSIFLLPSLYHCRNDDGERNMGNEGESGSDNDGSGGGRGKKRHASSY
ncbi:hypothetical protein E2C01_080289 [Portunus trituberculatus]|uniref:Uncharacterized protein n=1 Tax=Portunus trituberculatus TaxID=210409 RepID=A0A5B7ILT3_PORTR|nr:hypothetical protein [Portunus trituberculatus]